jgi:hypothetical protein
VGSDGDFRLGTCCTTFFKTEVYRLDFDDPVTLLFSHKLSIGGAFDTNDRWTLAAAGVTFNWSDPGTADLSNVTNLVGSIVF